MLTMPNIQGWMTEAELAWLYETAQTMQSIVEIGCWKGRSSWALLSGCPGTVHVVDHFQGSPYERDSFHREVHTNDIHEEFLANVGAFPNLVTHRSGSLEASKLIPAVDMVFIDGSHAFEDVMSDIEAWSSLARKLICGHDYQFPPVLMAVHQKFARVENPVGSIWVGFEKRSGRRAILDQAPGPIPE